jgi:hypothetical protein
VLQLEAILFFSFFASLALLICSSTIQEKASETNMTSSRNCNIEPQNFIPEKLSNLQLRKETQEKSCFRKQRLRPAIVTLNNKTYVREALKICK